MGCRNPVIEPQVAPISFPFLSMIEGPEVPNLEDYEDTEGWEIPVRSKRLVPYPFTKMGLIRFPRGYRI
jgi:hypothetical protein